MSIKSKMKVPYGLSVHGNDEIKAVTNVLKNSTQMGHNVRLFEKKVSKLFDKKYGLMVNSGSSALMLAMEVLNFPKGSEIITPVLTFGTTVSYIVKNNLIPVFVDVSEGTYCINEELIKKLVTKKTKAILAPNLLGNLIDWKSIYPYLKKKGIIIIEDSADTIGSKIKNKSSGYFSDISITSFYGSHIINCAGNGGMVCFNDKNLYLKAKLLRSWGRSSSLYDEQSEKIENRFDIKLSGITYDKKFVFNEIGHNLEPSEIGAAFGLVQLRKLNNNIKIRKKNFNAIFNFVKKYEDLFILPKQLKNSKTAWLAFPLTLKKKTPFSRTEMQIYLEKKGIQTRVVFTGNILRQPGFRNIKHKGGNKFPEADKIMRNGILFGCHQGINKSKINYMLKTIKSFIQSRKI